MYRIRKVPILEYSEKSPNSKRKILETRLKENTGKGIGYRAHSSLNQVRGNIYTSPGFSTMEFPPEDWPIFPAADFELAVPRDPGALGLEVMAQARINGRIVDHFRVTVGGSNILRVNFTTRSIFMSERIPTTPLQYEVWPRDIELRRNMASSEWLDVATLLASNDIAVMTGDEPAGSDAVASNEGLLGLINGAKDKTNYSASIRWAVVVGSDGNLELNLQTLPAAAAVLVGKPVLRG